MLGITLLERVDYIRTEINIVQSIESTITEDNLWLVLSFLTIKKLSLEWSNISQVFLWEYSYKDELF
ncbi:hypothetical protein ABXT54_02565 [Methylophilaceae bacterium Uisw_099_01]